MKANFLAGVALSTLAQHAVAKELRPNEAVRAKYESGSVHMEIMGLKMVRAPGTTARCLG